ncbi:MAG TPA: amidase [Gemmatimonadaceae bacterium]|jgi:aspartyl-tRNA(Asn)/glutamyl-tRNA(Gln) amidotransferase subunit A
MSAKSSATPSATDRLDSALAAIEQHDRRTNSFILIDRDGARAAAKAVDEERARGVDRGPLHGMTISIKDLVDIAGQPTTAGSNVRKGYVAAHNAPIIDLLRGAGAILVGKTNVHEFALGPTSDESAFGPVLNPHDTSRVSGGSSGGSAVAVATGMSEASIGSDTGGSIRIPAAAVGVVGLKPSFGEVSRDGVVPLSFTLDHVGPITKNVADAAAIWAVLAGRPQPKLKAPEASSLTFGELEGYFTALLDDHVRRAFEHALAHLRGAGATIESKSIEGAQTIVETYTNISLPEASRWHAPTLDTHAADYQPIVRQRLEFGRTIPAVAYLQAMENRETLTRAVDAALVGCDVLVLPTLPIVAPKIGEPEVTFQSKTGGVEKLSARMALLRLTQLFNITGHPAITLPIPSDGLPVGIQLVGRRDDTTRLLEIATTCERVFAGEQQ